MKTYITARGQKGTALPPLEVRPLRYFNFYGHRFFICRSVLGWYTAHELATGLSIGRGETIREAIRDAKIMLMKHGREQTERATKLWVKAHGRTNPPAEKKP